MADSDSTALRGALWPAHLAARPFPPRLSPMAQGSVGLIPRVPPPAQAVGAWCAAGALSHSGAGGGTLRCFNSLWTRMHRRSLGFASSGREMSKSLPSAFRAGRARQKAACRSFCSQASGRITSLRAQVLGAELQPGRAGSALRLRSADAKSPGPPPALMRAHVGLCAPLSAFAEPWPRWAYRPSRKRAGPGAGAIARAAPAPGRVHRSTGSEL